METPADRLIAATALQNSLTLITADKRLLGLRTFHNQAGMPDNRSLIQGALKK